MRLTLFIFFILFTSSVFASTIHRVAMIQNNVIVNISIWDDISPWNPLGYTLADITALSPQPGIGWTCVLCDGSDFQAPQQ